MKTQLKDNIFIEGFDDFNNYVKHCGFKYLASKTALYHGKTSEIPENIAKECVEHYIERCKYKNYNPDKLVQGIKLNGFDYAVHSIQSACDSPYCIIYKQE